MADEGPANGFKTRRITRACLQCRARKQRCLLPPEAPNAPCRRCSKLSLRCSFEDEAPVPDIVRSPSGLAQLVVDLHRRVNQHESKIHELEARIRNPAAQNGPLDMTDSHLPMSNLPTASPSDRGDAKSHMDGIDLGPPIATLRSLGALAKDGPMAYTSSNKPPRKGRDLFNPVIRGILNPEDAQFFTYCHNSAPVSSESTRYSWTKPLLHSPMLVLAICSIGARFWDRLHDAVHSRSDELVSLLDKAVSSLLLRPTPSDVTLDSIRVLLLYAQWMPYSKEEEEELTASAPRTLRSRYNEISAGAVLGLAMRYAFELSDDGVNICTEGTQSSHNQLPFNSVRWYRLSLNSASLTPLLSSQEPDDSVRESLFQPLNVSLSAAAQILISLSTFGSEYVWQVDSEISSTFPAGTLHADPFAIEKLYYGVDSTWISHTFAVTFLVICYIRGIIDDHPPQSLLTRLLNLAVDIFDSVCPRSTFHIARDFQGIVHYAVSLVLDSEEEPGQETEQMNDYAFHNLLEIMNDSGVDWAGNLLSGPSEWNMDMFEM
ncbi:hypothetical protein N7470_006086 [Penicillium chermesinum]|nr:hypothetical protein N7470_006086 [Penicillium chermesinum]